MFDRRILEVLSSGEAKSFQEIQLKAGFSHNTLRKHLDQLIEKDLVERRKESKEGPGRQSNCYSFNKNARSISALL